LAGEQYGHERTLANLPTPVRWFHKRWDAVGSCRQVTGVSFVTTSMVPNAGVVPAMFSVPDFCEAHGISKAFFYKLHKQGKAPPICKVGARSLITAEAAAEWRRGLEQVAA
jgi:hypothetical protein